MQIIAQFPIGSIVVLSNGKTLSSPDFLRWVRAESMRRCREPS